jgi:YD repeat-containing protein
MSAPTGESVVFEGARITPRVQHKATALETPILTAPNTASYAPRMKPPLLIAGLAVVTLLAHGAEAEVRIACPHANPADLSALQPPAPTPDTSDCLVEIGADSVQIRNGRWTGRRPLAGSIGSYRFDDEGRLLDIIEPRGHVVALRPLRRLVSVVDSAGQTTQFVYSGLGQLLAVSGPGETLATFMYSSAGRLVAIIERDGSTTHYSYDLLKRVTRIVDATGSATNFAYGAGRILTVTDAAGSTSLTYAAGALLVGIQSPSASLSFGYDSVGELTTVVDSTGLTTYAYSAGRLLTVSGPAGTTTYTYNSAGELVRVDSPAGTTAYSYTSGRVSSATTPDGTTTTYTYDGLGRVVSTTDPSGKTTFAYNTAADLVSVVDPANRTTTLTYAAGEGIVTCPHADPPDLSALGPPAPAPGTADCTASIAGGGLRVVDGRWSGVGMLAGGGQYRVNDAGRVLSVTDASGNAVELLPAQRLTRAIDFAGRTTSLTYNAAGQLSAVSGAGGTLASFAYSSAGRLIAATDRAGATIRYTYDSSNRLVGIVDPVGTPTSIANTGSSTSTVTDGAGTTSLTYSIDGNLIRMVGSGRTVDYSYDSAGRLLSLVNSGGVTSYLYNGAGLLVSVSTPTGTTTYTYDAAGEVVNATAPEGVTSYSYSAGRLTSVVAPDGTTTTYDYDATGRLLRVTTASGTTRYTYDEAGDVVSLTDRRARTTSFVYGDTVAPTLHLPGPLTAIATSTSGAVVSYTATATDPDDDSPAINCAPASGTTFPVGVTTVTCTALDDAGNQATDAFTVTVLYSTTAFLAPIDPGVTTLFKGSATPVKFALTGASAAITNLIARFYFTKEGGLTSGGDSFQYDPATGQYKYVWITKALAAGTYTIKADLGGGQLITAEIRLR